MRWPPAAPADHPAAGSMQAARHRARSCAVAELGAQLCQAAADPARDRPHRELQRGSDLLIALAAREEAVEDLLTVLGQRLHCGRDAHGQFDLLELAVRLALDQLERITAER